MAHFDEKSINAVVVAQLAERLLLTSKYSGSNSAISCFHKQYLFVANCEQK